MAFRYFERQEHSEIYEKYMIREPKEILCVILSYLKEKQAKTYDLALDVGCGTGQSIGMLASHFQKVVGVDISESQIEIAKKASYSPNISYLVASAEQLPLADGSVDLITSSIAAHYFKVEEFLKEVNRTLKPGGCLAIYCINLDLRLFHEDCSESLTDAFTETLNFLIHENSEVEEITGNMRSEYTEMFNAVPYRDKKRISNILVKRTMSIAAFMGFFESLCVFQNVALVKPEIALEEKCRLQEKIMNIMGTSSTDTELEFCLNYFCVLACKPA